MANVMSQQPMYYAESQYGPPEPYQLRWMMPPQPQFSAGWNPHIGMHEKTINPQSWQHTPRKPTSPRKAHPNAELSRTNIYISGLKADTTDDDLKLLCQRFGDIISTKAIIDRELNICKGYGFVMFDQEASARAAIDTLVRNGAQATFAKMTRAQVEYQRSEVDPTNLYFTNLHKDIDETQLTAMLLHCVDMAGEVVSCRVLRDEHGFSRGVGLARMDSRDACEAIIARLNGYILPGCLEPMRVKYANGPTPRRAKQSGSRPSSGYYPPEAAVAALNSHELSSYSYEDLADELLVPEAPGTPNGRRVPHSVLASPGSGSRLATWLSPREVRRQDGAVRVPVSRGPPQMMQAQDAYELDFAMHDSVQSVQHILDDY